MARVRERARTTPGRLRVATAVLVTGAIGFGVIATAVAVSRRSAADSLASSSEPQLVLAENLYASLSDADATAATTFLTGGLETAARHSRYLADLRDASGQLAALGRRAHSSPATRDAVAAIATNIPVYTGLVEAARANSRQGFPVGAAYLRRASNLMRSRMLPASERLYVAAAQRTDADYRQGTRNLGLVAAVVIGAALLVAFILTQVGVARLSNRLLNVPLLVATVILLGLGAWLIIGLVREQDALAAAQREGSDTVQLLSASRVLALRAQRDESLALIGRGSDTTGLADFDRTVQVLRGGTAAGGLLGAAERSAARAGSTAGIATLRRALARLEVVHRSVAARERRGRYDGAVTAYQARELPQVDRVDRGLELQTGAAQRRFATYAGDASGAAAALWIAVPLLCVGIAVLALQGLAARIREYR